MSPPIDDTRSKGVDPVPGAGGGSIQDRPRPIPAMPADERTDVLDPSSLEDPAI